MTVPLGWGAIRSTPQTRDPRDYKYVPHPLLAAQNPTATNFAPLLTGFQVANQGGCGDCVGFSTRDLWWIYSFLNGWGPITDVSGEFAYYESCLYFNPTPNCNTGSQIFYSLKSSIANGLCARSFNCSPTTPPTQAMLADAQTRKMVQYQNLFYEGNAQGVDAKTLVQTAIANRQCVIFGMECYASFRNGDPSYPPYGANTGGHALIAVDYDDWGIYGPNHWGTGWGCSKAKYPGWYSLPWAFVTSNDMFDTWTISGGVNAVGVTQGPLPAPPPPPVQKATPMISLVGAQFTIQNGNNPTGTVTVTAQYSGDAANQPASSTPLVLDAQTGQPAPPPVISPDGTRVPPSTSIHDAAGHIWTIGTNNATLLDGTQLVANGGPWQGSEILKWPSPSGYGVWVKGISGNWWYFTPPGTMTKTGPTDPQTGQ